MKFTLKWLLMAALSVGVFGCSSDDDDNNNSDTSLITAGSGASILGAALAAVGSADLISTVSTSELTTANQSSNDSLCSENGEPWDSNTNAVMADSEADYASRFFYCAVSSGTIESTDTLPGFLRQQESIFCSLEENLSISLTSFTDAGTEMVSSSPATLTLSEDCWPQGLPDGMTSVPVTSVIATSLDSSTTGYEYQVVMQSDAIGTITLRYFNSNGVTGFQNTQAGTSPGVGSDTRVTIDTTNGVILVNIIEDRNGAGGADSSYRTIARFRVSGAIDTSSYTFSTISEARGYYFVSGPGFDTGDDEDFQYNAYTVDGDSTTGYEFKRWNSTGSGNTPSEVSGNTQCVDGDETCSGSTDFTATEMPDAILGSNSFQEAWATYISSGLPMCEDSGNGDITFASAPASTGALGSCN